MTVMFNNFDLFFDHLSKFKKNKYDKMNFRELQELIQEGESSTLEFKRKVSNHIKIAKEISALANTIGGYLLVGVDDDGTVVGVRSEKTVIEFIEIVCDFHIEPPVEPEIDIINLKHKEVVVIYIPESQEKPHYIVNDEVKKSQRRAYIRVGEKSMIASREMARVLAGQNENAKPIKLSIGDKEKRLFLYLEKYEKATVKDFSKLVNISNRRAERLMVRLVRAGALQIHVDANSDYFTLVG